MEALPGGVFLGLDLAMDAVCLHRPQLEEFKRQGGRMWVMVYDLLPMQRPDWFTRRVAVRYQSWLETVASLADDFFCISGPVERELRVALAERYGTGDPHVHMDENGAVKFPAIHIEAVLKNAKATLEKEADQVKRFRTAKTAADLRALSAGTTYGAQQEKK